MRNLDYIAILETGVPPAGLDQTYGTYADMFAGTLAREGRAFRVFKTMQGELPPLDAALKGVVITGSPAGVYEGDPWIVNLINWLRQLDGNVPVVGICFGHQVMAQAYGGHVEKSHKGWGVGLHEYTIQAQDVWHSLLGRPASDGEIRVAVTHQDQVVKKPDTAIVLAGSEFTPHGALYYTDRKALSFQCHPEFCESFAEDLLISRRGVRIDAALVDRAVGTLKTPGHRFEVLGAISNFLEREVRPYYEVIDALENVYLEDSFVLGIYHDDRGLLFDLELVLTEDHALYQAPPDDERYCYRRAVLCFTDLKNVTWIEQNFLMSRTIDDDGSIDFGNIDIFERKDDTYYLDGSWGAVKIACGKLELVFA